MDKLVKLNIPTEITIRSEWFVIRDALLKDAEAITAIEDDKAFNTAGQLLNALTKHSNGLEKIRKELSKPYTDAGKLIKQISDEARQSLEEWKEKLQREYLNPYARRKAEEAEAERRRVEEQVRKEAERIIAEQEELRELFGDDEIPVQEVIVQQEALTVKEKPENDSVRIIERTVWELVDEKEVPPLFFVFDPHKVNEYLREHKDLITEKIKANPEAVIVPGIIFRIETQVTGR